VLLRLGRESPENVRFDLRDQCFGRSTGRSESEQALGGVQAHKGGAVRGPTGAAEGTAVPEWDNAAEVLRRTVAPEIGVALSGVALSDNHQTSGDGKPQRVKILRENGVYPGASLPDPGDCSCTPSGCVHLGQLESLG
jgi:hypothetical protein